MNIAIVTGASSGLGKTFVKQLDCRRHLDEIWVIARRQDRLEQLRDEIATPLRILSYDLGQRTSLQEIDQLLANEHPTVQVLVNAAGFGKIGDYQDIKVESLGQMIDVNVRALIWMTQISIPYMSVGSRIVEIASTAAFQPLPYMNVYASTKAMVYRYSRALHEELKPRGIGVTVVCPYWVKDTEFISRAKHSYDSRYIRSFPFASKQDEVVRKALADSDAGHAVSTPGFICTAHRITAKALPAAWMMRAWDRVRALPIGRR